MVSSFALRDDRGRIPSGNLLHLDQFQSLRCQTKQRHGCGFVVKRRIPLEPFQVHPNRCPGRSCATQTEHHPCGVAVRRVFEIEYKPLIRGNGLIHRVRVGKFHSVHKFDSGGGGCGTVFGRTPFDKIGTDLIHHGIGLIRIHTLVIIPAIKMPSVRLPMLRRQILHPNPQVVKPGVRLHQNGHPRQHRPQPILLADVVTPGPEALLSAQKWAVIDPVEQLHAAHQIAEEFPSRRSDEAGYPHGIGYHVQRRRGGHTPRHAPGPAAVLRKMGYGAVVGQYHGHGIGGGYEAPRPGDEIAVSVSVVGGSQGWEGGEVGGGGGGSIGVKTHFGY
mmetsp:Transcript_34115/g.39552  ORF Transcript_34115/g.39552 Transcript_34115/m.39552 type:complete len:332 (-) Transcript_34115:702-1697(-)